MIANTFLRDIGAVVPRKRSCVNIHGMSANLKKTLEELRRLPEDRQATLVERFDEMVARAKIDARLAASETRGGETPADTFFSELKAQYGG